MNTKVTSIRMSFELNESIKKLADLHHRSENEEMVVALEAYIDKEQSIMSQVGERPCILSVECPPQEAEFRSALEYLRSLFGWVQIEHKPNHAFLCASPKNGLSYDECQILCEQHFGRMHGIGWVYADAVAS